MRWFCLWLWVCLALLVWADPTPQDPVTCREEKLSDGTVLYIQNRLGNDMTVTLEFSRSENVTADPPFPCTKTIPGHSEIKMATIRHGSSGRWNYYYNYYWNFGSMAARHDNSVVYTLPYPSGQSMRVIQGFHGSFSHQGDDEFAIDFSHPEGTPVLCAREGTVVHVEERYSQGAPEKFYRNRVNVVRVQHADRTIGEYDHFRLDGVVVEEGQVVRRGQLLGYSGHTGFASGPHLHFVVYGAKDGHSRISYPIRFRVSGQSGPVELQQDEIYTAP